MRTVKLRAQGQRIVKVTISSKLRIDLEITKVMTRKNFGETLEQAYRFARERGFDPIDNKAS